METSAFGKLLNDLAKGLPDLERQISRIHAGHCSIKVFKSVLDAFRKTAETFDSFKTISQGFKNPLIAKLLASSPDVVEALDEVEEMFTGEGSELTPHEGHDELFDEAVAEVRQAEADLDEELDAARKLLKCVSERLDEASALSLTDRRCKDLSFRDIGIKDIYQARSVLRSVVRMLIRVVASRSKSRPRSRSPKTGRRCRGQRTSTGTTRRSRNGSSRS